MKRAGQIGVGKHSNIGDAGANKGRRNRQEITLKLHCFFSTSTPPKFSLEEVHFTHKEQGRALVSRREVLGLFYSQRPGGIPEKSALCKNVFHSVTDIRAMCIPFAMLLHCQNKRKSLDSLE